jgi:hypothetical protein
VEGGLEGVAEVGSAAEAGWEGMEVGWVGVGKAGALQQVHSNSAGTEPVRVCSHYERGTAHKTTVYTQ